LLLLCHAGEDAFVTSDLLHRSPLAVDIRRMWHDAISDDAGNDAGSAVIQLTACWERKGMPSSVSSNQQKILRENMY